MFRKLSEYLVKGLATGLGFSASLVAIIYIAERFSLFDNNDSYKSQDSRMALTLEELITRLPKDSVDLCNDIEGVWHGSKESDDGTSINSWEVAYEDGGRFNGVITTNTITEKTEEKQTGTWKCEKSILFNDLTIDGKNVKYNYLILANDQNERTYVHIGAYRMGDIFTSYRRVSM